MKSRPIFSTNKNKLTNNSYSFISTGPNIVQPIKGKRKIIQQNDNHIDLIRNFSKSNKQGNENLASLLVLRDDIIRKITDMEGELIRNNDLISNERQQLSIFGGEHLLENSDPEMSSNKQENITSSQLYYNYNTEQPDETATSKAIQSCIILLPFIDFMNESFRDDISKENNKSSNNPNTQAIQAKPMTNSNLNINFRQFFQILESLDLDSYSNFLKSSFSQLKWISECNEIYQKMQRFVESDDFIEKFHVLTEQLFFVTHDNVKIFLFDPKSNEYSTFNDEDGFIQISFNSEKSILSSIIAKQTPEIVKSPPNHSSYSSHIDKLFNKVDQSFFAFPIEKNALVTIFRLEEPFNKEDFIIGQFYSNLVAPLFDIHIKNYFVSREVNQRRVIREFEENLSEKVTFNVLLPYLFSFLSEEVEANDARLFIAEDDSFLSLEIEDDQIDQKKFPRCGIPEFIFKKKQHFETMKLRSDTFIKYDDRIDKWSADKSLIGFPVFSDKTVIAVLCVSDKNGWNKFNQWDVELVQAVSCDLSHVVPICMENEKPINVTSHHQPLLLTFPTAVRSFTIQCIGEEDGIAFVSRTIQNLLNCEWLSIYTTIDIQSTEIKKIVTLHDSELVDADFLDPSLAKELFSRKKKISVLDASKSIENFKTIGNVSPRDFLFTFNDESKEKVGLFAMNSKSGNEGFSEPSSSIVSALLSFVVFAMRIKAQSEQIEDESRTSATITNAFNVCESICSDKRPFHKLVSVLMQLLSMDNFAVLCFNTKKNAFDPILSSEDCSMPLLSVGCNDSLASQLAGLNGLLFISDFSTCLFQASLIAGFFPPFRQLLAGQIDSGKARLVIVFTGKSAASNYEQLFHYFTPLLRVFYQTFAMMREVGFVESCEVNRINLFRSKLTDNDITSLSFDARALSDQQKDEAVMRMFDSLGLIKAIGTDPEQLAVFIVKVRHSYKSEVPFHNYDHAVDCAQLTHLLVRTVNKSEVKLTSFESAALMFAALLHDVAHEGVESPFLTKTFSPLVYAHGGESTLEHFHLSTAVSLLQDHLISDESEIGASESFWSALAASILATDLGSIQPFLTSFDLLSKSFDFSKETQKIELMKLMTLAADSSRFFRPFSVSLKLAESLDEEKKKENRLAIDCKVDLGQLSEMKENEMTFIDNVVFPIVKLLCEIDGGFSFLFEKVNNTKQSWEKYKK